MNFPVVQKNIPILVTILLAGSGWLFTKVQGLDSATAANAQSIGVNTANINSMDARLNRVESKEDWIIERLGGNPQTIVTQNIATDTLSKLH